MHTDIFKEATLWLRVSRAAMSMQSGGRPSTHSGASTEFDILENRPDIE